MNLVVDLVIRKIRELGLNISAQKSETVVFPPRRYKKWTKEVSVEPEGTRINCNNAGIKYLGIIIDPLWSFESHFAAILNKANRITVRLSGIMRNLQGPGDRKRRLYANTVYAILLYGAPIWAEELEGNRRFKVAMRKLQRKLALRVISAYRTVSYEAAEVLARLPPVDLMALKLKRIYERKKRIAESGNVLIDRAVNAIKREEEKVTVGAWKERD
ncbi:hypothetical protein DMN91_009825 [Ooceraea biroi]|uniref:Reverse transcriptase domain-containing protein n=1 Tax=Ooceraea biroi TaxID=2015173 RepID=A0A3L8DCI5_OOCBI|nr:hypothetical protein DMN91_009825 [Ooceraea biroi]